MSNVKRGRKAIEVSAAELAEAIATLESMQPDGKFTNRSALWSALEETEWAKSRTPRALTGQVAMMIAKKNNLSLATPVGQKGRVKGCGPVVGGGRKKKQALPEIVQGLKNAVPSKYHDVVAKATSGSLKACIKLKCLDCVCFQKKEVALCTITDCSLWSVRPYKRVSLNMVEDSSDETNDSGTTV